MNAVAIGSVMLIGWGWLVGGAAIVSLLTLARSARPRSSAAQAARILGVTVCGSVVVLGTVGAAAGLVLGLDYPPTVVVAVFEGGCIGGGLGLVLGGVVGVVLAAGHVLRAARA